MPQRVRAGSRGGQARAGRMTPEQRAGAAKLAAQARWRKKDWAASGFGVSVVAARLLGRLDVTHPRISDLSVAVQPQSLRLGTFRAASG